MPAKRIIPALDINNGRVVKCVQFENMRDAGDPVERAAFYDREGADELVFLDITASHERRGIISDLAARVCEEAFIPFTVGGGLKATDEMAARRAIATLAHQLGADARDVAGAMLAAADR